MTDHSKKKKLESRHWWECRETWTNTCTLLEGIQKGTQHGISQTMTTYDPEIQLSGVNVEELKPGSWRDTCLLMFIIALFTINKTQKQCKCSSVGI